MISRRDFASGMLALPATLASLTNRAISKPISNKAAWMAGRWGIMLHWIAPGPAARSGNYRGDLNEAVDHFDLDRLISQISGTKASWVIFTVGQNKGYYASPNRYLDSIAGPGRTSKRDLILELAKELHVRRIALIAYAPGEVKAVTSLHRAFGWDPANQDTFQHRYTTFLREYSDRFEKYCAGWWIDGCYDWQSFPNSKRDWALWSSALRAGNSDRILSYNNGCFLTDKPFALTEHQDLLSGEADGFSTTGPLAKKNGVPQVIPLSKSYLEALTCQAHVVAPIDSYGKWGHGGPGDIGPPLYQYDYLSDVIQRYRQRDIALTFNVGIYQEGYLGDQTIELLRRLD